MNIFLYYKTLKEPYINFLDKHPNVKIVHVLMTFFLSGWTLKNTSQEILKIINKILEKKN